MFLEDMIKYYVDHIHGGVELYYKVKVPKESKLYKPAVKKILFVLGLVENNGPMLSNKKSEDSFNIHITNIMHLKHKVFENYLARFISVIKSEVKLKF